MLTLSFFLSEGCAQVRLWHWRDHLRWSFHSWNLHQSDSGCFQGAPPPDRYRSSRWPSAADRSLLRQHPNHCTLQHRLPSEICWHRHPMQQQGTKGKLITSCKWCSFSVLLRFKCCVLGSPLCGFDVVDVVQRGAEDEGHHLQGASMGGHAWSVFLQRSWGGIDLFSHPRIQNLSENFTFVNPVLGKHMHLPF